MNIYKKTLNLLPPSHPTSPLLPHPQFRSLSLLSSDSVARDGGGRRSQPSSVRLALPRKQPQTRAPPLTLFDFSSFLRRFPASSTSNGGEVRVGFSLGLSFVSHASFPCQFLIFLSPFAGLYGLPLQWPFSGDSRRSRAAAGQAIFEFKLR